MSKLSIGVAWLALALCGCGEPSEPAGAKASTAAASSAPAAFDAKLETQRVVDCFAAYRQSLLDQDGPRAAGLVSDGTIALYKSLRDTALTGKDSDVRALRLVDRLQVLLLRVRVPAALLETMDGRALFAHTVTQNWVGKAGVTRASLGAVDVKPGRAVAKLLSSGQPTGEDYHFVQRNGEWTFDLLPSVQFADQALQTQLRALNRGEDEFVLSMIATLTGKQPDASIWQPLR